VVDAQRTLAAAEQALAQMSAAIASDQVAVFLALGDGWEESI
jgi:outer membrane protein TolC